MAGRRIGPIARAKLARFKQILLTDLETLETEVRCHPYKPASRKCPLCYLHRRELGVIWHQHSNGKFYAYEEGKFPEWLN